MSCIGHYSERTLTVPSHKKERDATTELSDDLSKQIDDKKETTSNQVSCIQNKLIEFFLQYLHQLETV
jgi:hypothetical protein